MLRKIRNKIWQWKIRLMGKYIYKELPFLSAYTLMTSKELIATKAFPLSLRELCTLIKRRELNDLWMHTWVRGKVYIIDYQGFKEWWDENKDDMKRLLQ